MAVLIELSAKALTAIEVWLVAAITFIFFSFLELGLVLKIISCLDKDKIVAGENEVRNNLAEDLERSSIKGHSKESSWLLFNWPQPSLPPT